MVISSRFSIMAVTKDQLKITEKIPLRVTVEEHWIEKGIFILPPRIASFLVNINKIHLLYEENEDLLPYEQEERMIENIDRLYSKYDVMPDEYGLS